MTAAYLLPLKSEAILVGSGGFCTKVREEYQVLQVVIESVSSEVGVVGGCPERKERIPYLQYAAGCRRISKRVVCPLAYLVAGGPGFAGIPFWDCGCPVLALFARAGTMLPIP